MIEKSPIITPWRWRDCCRAASIANDGRLRLNAKVTIPSDERAIWLGRNILPHEPALRAWLNNRRLGDLDPDDIIQETYTRLINVQSVYAIRNPKSYMFEAAKSVIYSHLRRSKIVPMANLSDFDAVGFCSDDPTPEDYTIHRDELQRLAEALSALPDRARRVLEMRRLEEKSQKQIAAELGITEGKVEKLMGEALFGLRNMFGRQRNTASRASKLTIKASRKGHVQRDRNRD
jgi:RNA polymerase sigma-70 factor (ECF subfamily)